MNKVTLYSEVPEDILKFATKRQITNLFKEHLSLLKELQDKHQEFLNKLHDTLPDEYKKYVELADYYSDGEADRLRSKVLSSGNDTIRNLCQQIDDLSVDFK